MDIALILNFFVRMFSTLGERNAGNDGPRCMSLMPSESSVSNIHTAFCSYQDNIRLRGRSFTSHLKAPDRAVATCIAE